MSQVKNRKNKQSVNPAKNSSVMNQPIEQKHNNATAVRTIDRNESKEAEKVNDLDKNRLKNWKLRRELKKALNSDLDNSSRKKTIKPVVEKPSETKSKKSVVEEEFKEIDNEQDEIDSTVNNADEDITAQNIEQEYAPEKMELFKQKTHAQIGRFIRKISPYPVVKTMSKFWWSQLKKINFKQAFVLVVSALIVFAFVVPPVWSAIESYRAGMWQLFG